jgi:type 1 glutamine amidotransferase
MMTDRHPLSVVIACLVGAIPSAAPAQDLLPLVGEEALGKIKAALPAEPAAKPAKARTVLVFTESAGAFANMKKSPGQKYVPHASAPHAATAVALLGEKTGAFAATIRSDPSVFAAETLKGFDAIVLANVYLGDKLFKAPRDLKEADKPTYEARQKALLEFVAGGKGLVGLHNAACTALDWPEYQKMIGGTHHGHAWWAHQTVPIKLDDAVSPLNAAFGGKAFAAVDDIYQFSAPYTREAVHVLLSVDTGKAPESVTADRADGDYPVSWVKPHGTGRVFYTALGHQAETFQDAAFLKHLLAGIQFATGDLKADASLGKPPAAKADFTLMPGWTALFDGKDLGAWAVSPQQQDHWLVADGVIRYDGRAATLRTKASFRDYELRVDWRMPRVSDSGVFVRDNFQLNIWCWDFGSGEMWEHRGSAKTGPYVPASREDRPVGEWNTFLVTVMDDRVTVRLNGKEVITGAELKVKGKSSPIGLQQHGDPLEFKSIYIRDIGVRH